MGWTVLPGWLFLHLKSDKTQTAQHGFKPPTCSPIYVYSEGNYYTLLQLFNLLVCGNMRKPSCFWGALVGTTFQNQPFQQNAGCLPLTGGLLQITASWMFLNRPNDSNWVRAPSDVPCHAGRNPEADGPTTAVVLQPNTA